MQVILLQDVPNVGKKYEEVEVANGYGTNYLIPNGLAQVANDATRARYEKLQQAAEAERQEQREKLAAAITDLDGGEVSVAAERVGDQGQLFAGIYPKDIAAAINDEFDVEITGADIEREQPISKVGTYDVTISILDTEATLSVTVAEAPNQSSGPVEESEDSHEAGEHGSGQGKEEVEDVEESEE